MILCARACKQGIYVWMGYGAVEDLNFIFKIILSTQNSSDIDLVRILCLQTRLLYVFIVFHFLPTRGFTFLDITIIILLFMSRSVKYYN